MHAATLLDSTAFGLTVKRLCYQLVEEHGDLSDTVLLGLQPRGVHLSRRLVRELGRILGGVPIRAGELDITFHRDDFRHRTVPLAPSTTQMDLSIEGRRVVLIDDVLYTGRSIRAGLDALLSFGRPASVQLLVLIDRRFARELPIAADHVGRWVDSIEGQRVTVEWAETDGQDRVLLHGAEVAPARGGQPPATAIP
ncbi:MAG: bifunctional pyr operon transcriptional regulator/uracil phosphoribosyltransferase PyrR [Flavobacteriales bacterium]|nr:Bifunctional protein PyrR [Flavobacteriales bacterium]MCC6578616.1 bifunctional pyr operon transcriptional regulator/uracil phosphoribosyltransferase PyrR [Flavobacteriales bacterium]NUQ16544.1 bifunctional pyr operon transcriptional regulator/uracil phosphoribosyltransferase PyrR [Flavobacteriales bacterium]